MFPLRTSIVRFSRSLRLASALLILAMPALAQRPTGGAPTPGAGQRSNSPSFPTAWEQPVDVLVSVREPSGMPLAGSAIVKLYSPRGAFLTAASRRSCPVNTMWK
jgi:hypothetical protein